LAVAGLEAVQAMILCLKVLIFASIEDFTYFNKEPFYEGFTMP
jgi:hypothetical protein